MDNHFEAERRFLVENLSQDLLKSPKLEIVEGYLNDDGVRVRVVLKSDQCVTDELSVNQIASGFVGMNIHKPRLKIMLDENHQVSPEMALSLLDDCGNNVVRKTCYQYQFDNAQWAINVYREKFAGLKIADVSSSHDLINLIKLPSFVRREVTTQMALRDQSLCRVPNLEILWGLIYGYPQKTYQA